MKADAARSERVLKGEQKSKACREIAKSIFDPAELQTLNTKHYPSNPNTPAFTPRSRRRAPPDRVL